MAIKGVSKFVVAPDYKYDPASNKATYGGDPVVTERVAEYSADITFSEDSGLYLDNALSEKGNGKFTKGTITVSTGELTNATAKLLLNLKELEQEVNGKQVKGLYYDRNTKGKTVGTAVIEEHQDLNKDFYRAMIFPKTGYNVPADAATTRGESISWQTKQVTGEIMESDETGTGDTEADRPWKATFDCETEAEALALIKEWFTSRKRTGA